jgi:hypothetical protein
MNNKFKYSLVLAAVTLASGCSSLGVEPWERDLLAKEQMALTSSPIDSALDDIYFSKEASSGGKSFGGGGCGCN